MNTGSVNDANRPNAYRPLSTQQHELRALRGLGRSAELNGPDRSRASAAQVVSEIAFKPLLAEMRKLPFGKDLFHGGRTEEIFSERLDELVADRVALAEGGGLTAQIERYFDGTQSPLPGADQTHWHLLPGAGLGAGLVDDA